MNCFNQEFSGNEEEEICPKCGNFLSGPGQCSSCMVECPKCFEYKEFGMPCEVCGN